MNSPRITSLLLSALIISTLAACGGGGDTTTTAPPSEGVSGYPGTGTYGWTLKASGPTSALRHGLSLVHPAMPENEYVIETATQAITDTRLEVRGTVDAGQHLATQAQAHALLYIFGGDVRSVPMQANGAPPSQRVQRSNTSTACRFVLAANDHAHPDNSRYIVSTAGADGVCSTADDGRAEVRHGSGSVLDYALLSGDAPLEVARDPVTLAPRGWIYPRQVVMWDTTQPAITLRAAGSPALTQVLASTPRALLASDGTRLSVVSFSGATATETLLNAALTAGSNWRLIGFDTDHFYVYSDTATGAPTPGFNSPWSVLRIAKTTPTAASIASGTGFVSVASMGNNQIYLTVFQLNHNLLVRVTKTGGHQTEQFPLDTSPTVQTSAAGRHLLWLVTGVGSQNVNYRIDVIDENGATSQQWLTGAFPLNVVNASTVSFEVSESRTRFLIAHGFGARAFSNASLVDYDAQAGVARTLGTLPEYGTDFVFASAAGGPGSVGVGFATRSSQGAYVEQGAKVFSYALGTAGSLTTATRQ